MAVERCDPTPPSAGGDEPGGGRGTPATGGRSKRVKRAPPGADGSKRAPPRPVRHGAACSQTHPRPDSAGCQHYARPNTPLPLIAAFVMLQLCNRARESDADSPPALTAILLCPRRDC